MLDEVATINRRDLLRLAARGMFITVGGAALGTLAGGCGLPALPSGGTGATSSGAQSVASGGSGSGISAVLPTYVPLAGPAADFPATPEGVPPGYYNYPKNPVKSVAQAPGNGGDMTLMSSMHSQPPPVDQNAAWQALNTALNVNLKVPLITSNDYNLELQKAVAGGSLPDIFKLGFFGTASAIPDVLQFLQSECAELTPYLAGDAIKDYPNLANFPSWSWLNGVFDGKLYAIPTPGNREGTSLHANQAFLDEVGVKGFNTTDDFTRFCQDITKPGDRYAMTSNAAVYGPVPWYLELFGAPNNWRNDNGKLVKDLETPEYREAVAYARSLWDLGVYYPDSATVASGGSLLYGGKVAFWFNGLMGFQLAWESARAADPGYVMSIVPPFPHDGKGKGIQHLGSGAIYLTALKKGSPDRIKEVLGVLNYLAAPFGTTEYVLRHYGVENVDHTLDDSGNPVFTTQGNADLASDFPIWNLPGAPEVLYDTKLPDAIAPFYQAEKDAFSLGLDDPTIGLFSATFASKGPILTQSVTDGVNDILYGRNPVSSLDQIIQDWKANGGDQIRSEYEAALENAVK